MALAGRGKTSTFMTLFSMTYVFLLLVLLVGTFDTTFSSIPRNIKTGKARSCVSAAERSSRSGSRVRRPYNTVLDLHPGDESVSSTKEKQHSRWNKMLFRSSWGNHSLHFRSLPWLAGFAA